LSFLRHHHSHVLRRPQPAAFPCLYGDDEAWVNINTLAVFHGRLPSRALGLMIEWASMHQDELRRDWELAKNQQKPERIAPLK
jgi:hypothetical protein